MRLIRLSCDCVVNPMEIAEVTKSESGEITVRMKSGIGHHVERNYGEASYAAMDRITKEIDAAMAASHADRTP